MSNEKTTIENVLEYIEDIEMAYELEACVVLHVLNGKIPGIVHPVFNSIKEEYWVLQNTTVPKVGVELFKKITITGDVPAYKEALKEAWDNEELRSTLQELIAWRMCVLARIPRDIDASIILSGLEVLFCGE